MRREVTHSSRRSRGSVPVYYDHLQPSGAHRSTVIMVHGGTQSGACFLRTIDDRPGWAYRLADAGFTVAVPDWPGIGRSGYVPSDALNGEIVCQGLSELIAEQDGPVVLLVHSISGAFGWHLAATHRPQVTALIAVAPAPPGDMQPVPMIVSETKDHIRIEGLHRPLTVPKADFLPELEFVTQKLVGTSRYFPRDAIGALAASLRPIPHRLLQERWNIGGSQIKIGNLAGLRGLPILIMTGTEDLDHTRDIDGSIAVWLREQAIDVEFMFLGDHGVTGNSHMLMIEQNSDQLAGMIVDWLQP